MAKPLPAPFDKVKVVAENRRARYDYYVEDKFEAGIELVGTEVKALRTGQSSIAIRRPLPDSVTTAVRRAGPPKHRWVVKRSGRGTKLVMLPSGETVVMPPCISVATHTLPSASTAIESKRCQWPPGDAVTMRAPFGDGHVS